MLKMFDWRDWVSGLSYEDLEDLRKIVEDEIKWRKEDSKK